MSENDQQDDWDLEDLLKQVPLASPPVELDRRIARLFRPGARWWTGALAGLAAGIAVTAGVFLYRPHGAATSVKPVVHAIDQPPPRPAYIIENRTVRSLGDGEINGLQVRLERSQSRIVVWQKTESGAVLRAEIALPEKTTVHTVQRF